MLLNYVFVSSSVQFSSFQLLSRVGLSDPVDCMPGFPVHHQLPELTQTHVHQVGDAIQPSHPVVPFSSCLQSFPASGSFPMSQFFASGGPSIGASASVLPMNIQDWFPLGLTGLISLQSKGLSNLLQHRSLKASVLPAFSFLIIMHLDVTLLSSSWGSLSFLDWAL